MRMTGDDGHLIGAEVLEMVEHLNEMLLVLSVEVLEKQNFEAPWP